MHNRVVIDTGPLLAAFNSKDPLHEIYADWLSNFDGELFLPYPVFIETCWSLEKWPHLEAALIQSVIDEELTLIIPTTEDLKRIVELVTKYRDLRLGIVDASVVATAERYRIRDVSSIDSHLEIVKPKHVNRLTIIP
jgi:uncharacterized protein